MRIGKIPVGDGAPLVLICGLNVLENEADAIEVARTKDYNRRLPK